MRRIRRDKRLTAVLLFVAAILVAALVALGGAMKIVPYFLSLAIGGLIGVGLALGLWSLGDGEGES